jgi:hypothetical protein
MQNHVSSKPFKHIAAGLLCQPAVHTPFTRGFPQLSGAECLRCDSQIGPHPAGKPLQGSRLSANSNMRPSPGAKNWHIYSTRRGKRSENLSKDQFGVLAKGTLRKLYSRIEAPWPELIEGVLPSCTPDAERASRVAQNRSASHTSALDSLFIPNPYGERKGGL